MDIEIFIQNRKSTWFELEKLLDKIEDKGLKSLSHKEARQFISLYRSISSDLNKAQTYTANAQLNSYLHSLVARAYVHVYHEENPPILQNVKKFFMSDYPWILRKYWIPMLVSLMIFSSGMLFGALAFVFDTDAHSVLIPGEHLVMTPSERVQRIEKNNGIESLDSFPSATFSSFIFANNVRVSLLVFASGISLGIITVLLLFYNGIILGAMAMYYHMYSEGVFFYAWILPHGVVELTAIVIAGGSGFLLAKPFFFSSNVTLKEQYSLLIKDLVKIVLGTSALLLFAGIVEGTISQIHAPRLPYWVKLVFSFLEGLLLFYYLIFFNRRKVRS
ncbi:MAG: stage II sporulation protein M [Candidatus Aureabacteria bacterium]|nr:stage II sporulation protein M [Candidatus Auribacterota bacterium]